MADCGDVVRNEKGGQAATAAECPIADCGNAGRDGDGGQAGASVEGEIADFRDAVRDGVSARVPRRKTDQARLIPVEKNPALNAYLNSMVNLGFLVEQEAREEAEEEIEESELTFDDIELSELGAELASAYDSVVRRLGAVKKHLVVHR